MKKRIIALLVTGCMLLASLSGCSSKTTETDQSEPEQSGSTETSAPAVTEAASGYDFSDRDFTTLKVLMFGDSTSDQAKAVSEALSKITKEKLNCDVDITFVGFGSYATQLNLMLSSGEQLDLFSPFTLGAGTLANAGQILPMDDLLATYGKDTLNAVSQEDWQCAKINGQIFGVPCNKDKAYNLSFTMRKDVLDELGVSVDSLTSFDDLHDLLEKVKEAHPEMYPVISNYGGTFSYLPVDSLGGGDAVLLDPYNSDSLKVENFIASDYFKNLCETMYSWAKEGLIMPDASTNSEGYSSLIGSGKGFGYFIHTKQKDSGYNSGATSENGTDMESWIYKEAISVTNAVALVWSVPTTSVDPDRAMALLDLMYNDPEVSNLCIYGVEGVHYQVIDKDNGIIDYPEGVTASTVGYTSSVAWGWPNEQIAYIWNGNSATAWKDLNSFNASAKQSPAKGFTFDNSSVINEATACNNVDSKYYNALLGGQLDPEVAIPKYLQELKDNGIDTIIAEKQKQLDAWAESNK
ncbi:MAG: extracellular solute-binding protein [Anaerocolumna sp.]|jgi:putative aldouronate transport system substrate-binding protein|nr:extracellular solute-binding protein [Anaerocolumna sp.]